MKRPQEYQMFLSAVQRVSFSSSRYSLFRFPSNHSILRRNMSLSSDETARYSRQLILPEIGVAGQVRMKNSSVLIVGCGGLGCPAAQYLAAAGIGRIGLMDGDVVETSNLHRQILHREDRIGTLKTKSVI